jgi:hypothetical protein
MEDEQLIKNGIQDLLKNAIKAELLQQRPSRAYDGRPKPVKGGSTPYSNRNYSGRLLESVTVEFVEIDGNLRLQVSFPNAPEWYWVNYGRQGKQQNPSLKYPPLAAIDRWVVAKPGINLQVRDAQGRFIERKSLVYLIQRSIGQYGYYGIRFIDQAIRKTERNLEQQFGEWAREYFTNIINEKILVGPVQAQVR